MRSTDSWRQAIAYGAVAALFAALLPLGVLLRRVRAGNVEDRDVRQRGQRPALLVVALVSIVGGTALLAATHAPRELLALLAATITGLVVALAVTTVWKISIHVAVAAGTVAVLAEMYGSLALVGALAVLLVAWSRLILTHHTSAQVMAGAGIGVAVAGWVFGALT